MVLPDTSVWVDFSRRGKRGRAVQMRELLDAGEVATCGPVAVELLAGAEGSDGRPLPLTDVAIAVAAARAGFALWGLDSDFERLAGALDDLELV